MAFIPWGGETGQSGYTSAYNSGTAYQVNDVLTASRMNAALRMSSLIAAAVGAAFGLNDSIDSSLATVQSSGFLTGISYNSGNSTLNLASQKLTFSSGNITIGNSTISTSSFSAGGASNSAKLLVNTSGTGVQVKTASGKPFEVVSANGNTTYAQINDSTINLNEDTNIQGAVNIGTSSDADAIASFTGNAIALNKNVTINGDLVITGTGSGSIAYDSLTVANITTLATGSGSYVNIGTNGSIASFDATNGIQLKGNVSIGTSGSVAILDGTTGIKLKQPTNILGVLNIGTAADATAVAVFDNTNGITFKKNANVDGAYTVKIGPIGNSDANRYAIFGTGDSDYPNKLLGTEIAGALYTSGDVALGNTAADTIDIIGTLTSYETTNIGSFADSADLNVYGDVNIGGISAGVAGSIAQFSATTGTTLYNKLLISRNSTTVAEFPGLSGINLNDNVNIGNAGSVATFDATTGIKLKQNVNIGDSTTARNLTIYGETILTTITGLTTWAQSDTGGRAYTSSFTVSDSAANSALLFISGTIQNETTGGQIVSSICQSVMAVPVSIDETTGLDLENKFKIYIVSSGLDAGKLRIYAIDGTDLKFNLNIISICNLNFPA